MAAQKADQAECRNITLNVNSFGFAMFAAARVLSTRRHKRAQSFVNITQMHERANIAVQIKFLYRIFRENVLIVAFNCYENCIIDSVFSRLDRNQITTIEVEANLKKKHSEKKYKYFI